MNAWDKLQLGWLNYDTAKAGVNSWHKLGLAEYNTKHKQALVVSLPDKAVTTEVVTPAQGATQWWSGSGNDLKNTLTRSVDLTGKSSAVLSLDGWYDIEADYDYLYAEVSDGGANWTVLDGTVNGQPVPRDASGKPALTGSIDAYAKLSYPLDAYAGKKFALRFRYQTDGGVALKGFAADEIAVTADGSAVFSDNAESADPAWTATGFSRIGASFSKPYKQYYVAENRQYVSYDKTLKVGPYNFGFSTTRPDWVEHIPYQNGLLIWKWDTSQPDNNTADHPGHRPDPADRLAPGAAEVDRRHAAAQPVPGLRLAVHPGVHRRDHAAQGGRAGADQVAEGGVGLQRPHQHLLRRVEPGRRCQDH